jgi:hypothetical protein
MILQQQYENYRRVVANGLANKDCITEWEVKFLSDFDVKFDKFGLNTFVTANQDEAFDWIEKTLRDKLGDDYANS